MSTTTKAFCAGHDYSNVFSKGRDEGIKFADLPGFTRSAFERDHALITPESRVWSGTPGWANTLTAHLISPAFPMGAEFAMYLVDMQEGNALDPSPRSPLSLLFTHTPITHTHQQTPAS